jgi:hypothetical protein
MRLFFIFFAALVILPSGSHVLVDVDDNGDTRENAQQLQPEQREQFQRPESQRSDVIFEEASLAFSELVDAATLLESAWRSHQIAPEVAAARLRAAKMALGGSQSDEQAALSSADYPDKGTLMPESSPWENSSFLAFLRLPLFAALVAFFYAAKGGYDKKLPLFGAPAARVVGRSDGRGFVRAAPSARGLGSSRSGELLGGGSGGRLGRAYVVEDDDIDQDAVYSGGDDSDAAELSDDESSRPLHQYSYETSAREEPLSSDDEGSSRLRGR